MRRRRTAPIVLVALGLPAAAPAAPGSLDIAVAGLRSQKGLVQLCITATAAHFPDCSKDPAARKLTMPAAQAATIHVGDLAPGGYAIAIAHDENANGRVDTRFGIPTEGVGFSNNPHLYFGPPSFATARIAVGAGTTATTVKLRYFF